MSLTQRVHAAVKASPGMTSREVAEKVGATGATAVNRIAALLHQSATRGKIRRDVKLGRIVHFATPLIDVDQRKTRRKYANRVEQLEARRERRRAQKADKPARARVQPRVKPAAKPRPTTRQAAAVTALFGKQTRLRPPAHAGTETVEQFLARGGVIEVLPPGACSRPLSIFEDEDTLP